ncbi:hypothetical protein U1Q18_036830 [Sarracenia purpurea var. burkii]
MVQGLQNIDAGDGAVARRRWLSKDGSGAGGSVKPRGPRSAPWVMAHRGIDTGGRGDWRVARAVCVARAEMRWWSKACRGGGGEGFGF